MKGNMQNMSFHCMYLPHAIIHVRICETHCVFGEKCRALRSFMKLWSDAFVVARHRFTMTENGARRSLRIKVCRKVCALRERERERERERILHPQVIWPRPRNTSAMLKKKSAYFSVEVLPLIARNFRETSCSRSRNHANTSYRKLRSRSRPQFPFRPDRDSLSVIRVVSTCNPWDIFRAACNRGVCVCVCVYIYIYISI